MRKINRGAVAVFFLMSTAALVIGAVSQIDLTFQVKGLLPKTNGGTGISSTATFPSSGVIVTTTTAGYQFADAEVPSGTINGSNVTFTLAHTPSPALSTSCFENGLNQIAGSADYTLSTATITYGTAPPTGTTLICNYRY